MYPRFQTAWPPQEPNEEDWENISERLFTVIKKVIDEKGEAIKECTEHLGPENLYISMVPEGTGYRLHMGFHGSTLLAIDGVQVKVNAFVLDTPDVDIVMEQLNPVLERPVVAACFIWSCIRNEVRKAFDTKQAEETHIPPNEVKLAIREINTSLKRIHQRLMKAALYQE